MMLFHSKDPSSYYKVYKHILFKTKDGKDFLKEETEKFRSIKIVGHITEVEVSGDSIYDILDTDPNVTDPMVSICTRYNFYIGKCLLYCYLYGKSPDYSTNPWSIMNGSLDLDRRTEQILAENLPTATRKLNVSLKPEYINSRYRKTSWRKKLIKYGFIYWMRNAYNGVINHNVPGWLDDLTGKLKSYSNNNIIENESTRLSCKKHIVKIFMECARFADNSTIDEAYKEFLATQILEG